MRLTRRLILLTAVLSIAGAARAADDFTLPPPSTSAHVDFYSDHFDYDKSSDTAHLKGHVVMRESTWTIHSNEMWLNLESRRARASGYMQMDDGRSLIYGDGGEFDFSSETGFLDDASAGFAPWRIHSATARALAGRDLLFRHAWFTSCNMDPNPHYRFRATSVRVRPKSWMFATNCVFYLGDTPLFYSPFLWKSLRSHHRISTRFNPGYDHRNGMFMKSTTLYHPLQPLYGRFFLDYYGVQGTGVGNELEYNRPGLANGAVYGYAIRERPTGQKRWGVFGDHFEAFPSSIAFQMRVQAQSDPDFNNAYVRSNSLPVTSELVNGGALVRTTKWSTTRLSYSRLDEADPTGRKFVRTDESKPRLDFLTMPLKFSGVPCLNIFNAFANNEYTQGLGYTEKSAGAGWRGTRALPLVSNLSLTPFVGLNETYDQRYDQFLGGASTRTFYDAMIGRFSLGGTLHTANVLGQWDLGHAYGRRLTPNSFSPDAHADDRGVETDLTTLEDYFRPSRNMFVRLNTGYDWRTFRDHAVGFRDRVQPFGGDVDWSPRTDVDFTAHDDYQLDHGNEDVVFQADFGRRKERFFGFGVGQTLGSSGHYFAGQEFAWHPSSGSWKIGGLLRQDVRTSGGVRRLNDVQLFDKELWFVKEWHDFVGSLEFRIRPGGVKEVKFHVTLRLDKDRPLRSNVDAPWRLWKAEEPPSEQ